MLATGEVLKFVLVVVLLGNGGWDAEVRGVRRRIQLGHGGRRAWKLGAYSADRIQLARGGRGPGAGHSRSQLGQLGLGEVRRWFLGR